MEEYYIITLSSRKQTIIGILWIFCNALIISCPDSGNVSRNCDILPMNGLNCSYSKGKPQETTIVEKNTPGAVIKDLRFSVGYVPVNGKCEARINVTWGISYNVSLKYLRGFFLTMSILNYNGKASVDHVITVSSSNWSAAYHTLFRHECLKAERWTFYHIELYSLPMNPRRHHATVDAHTSKTFSPHNQCKRTGDPNRTFNWTATMWTSANPLTASIEVCFYTAPASFKFKTYNVFLLPNDVYNRVIQGKDVIVDLNKDVKVCHTFQKICSGFYKIWVVPANEPRGTCRNGVEYYGSCTATAIDSINMTASDCSGTSPTPRTTTTVGSVDKTSGLKILGISIAVVLTIIVVAGLTVGLYIYKYRPLTKRLCNHINGLSSTTTATDSPSYPIEHQQTVLLVYSSDSEHHRKVVRTFAAFLHSCCKCDVRFDDWSQVDISQTNALDWLTKQLHQVKHIIFINSLGAFMQHKAWIDNATCLPVRELLLPDMFIPALRQIQARVYDKPQNKHLLQYYHVYFPYTDVKHLLDVSFGQRYKLMKHLEDLFLNIHGMTKYSGKGLTSACQINEKGYACSSAEGQALQSAVEEAGAYYKRNPDWFHGCYTYRNAATTERKETLIEYRPVANGDSHCTSSYHVTVKTSIGDGSSSPPGSFDSAELNNILTKSSDEGVHSDPDIIPPSSSSGSCSSNMERKSGSDDVGFGDAMEDSMFYTNNSPSVNLGFFCPPVLDDDDDGEEDGSVSIGSRILYEKLKAWNDQYDRGSPFSSIEGKA